MPIDPTLSDQSFDAVSAPSGNQQLVRTQSEKGENPQNLPESELNLIKEWQKKVLGAKDKFNPQFKKMRENMEFARYGAKKDYKGYIVPLTARHINQKVSQLYARKPTVSAEVQRKVMFSVWDEDPQTFVAAVQKIEALIAANQDPSLMAPSEMAIVQEVAKVKQEHLTLTRMARTAEIVCDYFIKPRPFKRRMKQMVRRSLTTKVGYIDLSFQRLMRPDPAITAQIDDHMSQIRRLESLAAELKEDEGEIDEFSTQIAAMKNLIADLQKAPQVIFKEGPVFDFPRSNEIIVDPKCRQLHGFDGADWVVRQWTMTPDRVQDLFKVDVDTYTPYKQGESVQDTSKPLSNEERKGDICVWRVQDKEKGQEFFIADGFPGWLKPPGEPEMLLDRFFTVFSFVPNDVEDDEDIYPPSDVEWMKSAQNEMNDIRQRLHEHRIAAIPGYIAAAGALDNEEKHAVLNSIPHGITQLKQFQAGAKVQDLLALKPVPVLDPNVYNDKPVMDDVLRSVGAQEANIGPAQSNTTATQSSIAENSRMASSGSSVDDLDDLLTELVESVNEANLLYLSKETVIEIAGPNAVWPDQAASRVEAIKKLSLRVQAGSSGRLNAAATLANMERAAPIMLQIPGVNMVPFARRYAETLELPVDEMVVEGAPSVTALNAMASKTPPAANPEMGGGAPQPKPGADTGRQEGPQPGMPAPGSGMAGGPGPSLTRQ